MSRFYFCSFVLAGTLAFGSLITFPQSPLPAAIVLPAPLKDGAGMKNLQLMSALNARRTTYSYFDRDIPLQTLSNLLWAADGVNRPNGKRTAPSR